jgi:AcrR family transcriptional regulator
LGELYPVRVAKKAGNRQSGIGSAEGQKDVEPTALRRVRGKSPRTGRGEKTQAKILDAARVIFDRDGYAGSRILDIAEEAGVALGTFYVYFDDKDDVLAMLLDEVFRDLFSAARAPYLDSESPEEVLRGAVRGYMLIYRRNRHLMRTLMEAATTDPKFAKFWFEVRGSFLVRVARNIEAAQSEGRAPSMSPIVEASALGGMLENMCWIWFAMGGERRPDGSRIPKPSLDEMVDVVTKLWIAAVLGETSKS